MNQKNFKSPTGSQSISHFRNSTPQNIEPVNASSQQNSTDSPANVENRIDCLKIANNKKPLSAKLAFLLDIHPGRERKSSLLANTLKNLTGNELTTPLNRNAKSRKTSDAKYINTAETPKAIQHLQSTHLSQTVANLEQSLSTQIRQKKLYNTQIDDIDTSVKSLEGHSKIRERADSIDAKRMFEANSTKHSEAQRLRKLRKNHKLMSGNKGDQSSNNLALTHLSCNFSHSPDNSLFLKNLLATTTSTNKNENNAFQYQSVPLHTPKQGFLSNSKQYVDYFDNPAPKERTKTKKNNSISETIPIDLQQKAYLSYNISSHNQQGHRKVGSSSASVSNILGKSFMKSDKRQNSPNVVLGIKTPQSQSIERNFFKSPDKEAKNPVKKGIEIKIPKKNVEFDLENLNGVKSSFDSYIVNNESQISNIQNNSKLLRKIKEEYEAIIDALINENKKLKEENKKNQEPSEQESEKSSLIQENQKLQKELADIKSDRERLQALVKGPRSRPTSSPSQSVLPTEKRTHNLKHDSPPLTKHFKETEKAEHEIIQLKQILLKQQNSISMMKKKEAKMMRLIYAIRKQGVDVEKIYNEEVKGKFEHLANEETIPTLNKEKSKEKKEIGIKDNFIDSVQREDIVSQVSGDELGKKSLYLISLIIF